MFYGRVRKNLQLLLCNFLDLRDSIYHAFYYLYILYIALILTIAYNFWAANYLKRILNGLTGDTYGALAESGNVFFLLSLSIVLNLIDRL